MRLIIEGDEDNWLLAMRAGRAFLKRNDTDCAIIAFAGGPNFLVTRNKASISVRQEAKTDA